MRVVVLIALTVLLAAVAGAALLLSWRPEVMKPTDLALLKTLFSPRPHDFKQLSGGLLVHMMTIDDVDRLLGIDKFVLDTNDRAITNCSLPDEHHTGSCSAWTYLRSDLMPTIFNTPMKVNSSPHEDWNDARKMYSTPVIGIIINPALAWPLISSMGVVDASTSERNCGQYYFSDSKTVQVKCTEADRGVGSDTSVEFHGPLRASELCQKDCDDNDAYCKYQNSGGTIAMSMLGSSALGNWGCQDCSGPFPKEGVQNIMSGCSQSSLPFLCSLDNATEATEGLVDPNAWAPYSKHAGYARAHIGPEGDAMQNLFETPTGLADTRNIGGTQCKFQRNDWDSWVNAIKRYYKTFWKHYDSTSKSLRADLKTAFGHNYLMSCPRYYYSFLENEVNLYFNPKSDQKKYQELAEHQSRILRNAIVGFFSVGKTCKQQLQSLEGSSCSFDGATYTGAEDRCIGWFCGKDATQECKDNFLSEEQSYLHEAKMLAKQLATKFNATYRIDGHKRPAGLFTYVGSNSTFLDPKYLEILIKDQHISLEEVFAQA